MSETCENCGRTIGKLETPHVWKENIVCRDCNSKLREIACASTALPDAIVTPPILPQHPPAQFRRGDIICPNPNCGYIGKPKKIARGSAGVGCLLCLLMLLPG